MRTDFNWPGGARFAFTICDDTDWSTVANTRPVYDFLASLGMRTTKLVWAFSGEGSAVNGGETLEDPHYVEWLQELRAQGFEIGFHNAAPSTSSRDVTLRALDRFHQLFGEHPRVFASHTECRDGMYMGEARVSSWVRPLYNRATGGKRTEHCSGHDPASPMFWGDVCKDRITYVRNFTVDRVNTSSFCPWMPYHDSRKPFVNFWFAGSNGSSPKYFRKTFTEDEVSSFIETGGLCVMYAHLAAKFYDDGQLDSHFRSTLERLAGEGGWFAPVSTVLDHLRNGAAASERRISTLDLARLELRWMLDRRSKKPGI